MRVYYCSYRVLAAATILLTALAVPATTASATVTAAAVSGPATDTAYQISISHDGYSGDTTVKPPLSSRWTHAFAGPVSYPLIAGGLVYVTVADNGGSYGTNLYALDQSTGATVWSQPIGGTYYWSNAAYDNGQVFVLNYDGLLRAFDAATGALNWSSQLPGTSYSSPPTAADGVIYITGGILGLYAVSESSGSILWGQPVENGDHSSPALDSSSVFVAHTCGLVYAFDRTTSQSQWATTGSCSGGGGRTPVYHDGKVYARDTVTGNQTIDATTGQLLGTFNAGPAPAFAGKIGLFLSSSTVSSGGTLQAADSRGTLWAFAGDGGLDTAPIIVGSTVYVGSSSGMLYGLSLKAGKVVWSTNVGAGIYGPDEQDVSSPLTGLGAGQGLLVVPAGDQLTAYGS